MRAQKSSHKKNSFFFLRTTHVREHSTTLLGFTHKKVAILEHTLARASTGQAGSQRASLLLSARKKRMRMITFLGSFSSSFFVLPGNSVRMLPAFRQGMRPFPGMHLSCALFLDRISTWWAREIVRRSLFFSCTFFTWHASLWRSGLSMNLTLPIKNFVLLFYG